MTAPVEDALVVQQILASFFPSTAYVCAKHISNYEIHPEEEAVVAGAVVRRRWEFSTGRALAREGLQRLGFPDDPIGVGRLHDPRWPEGVRGAISHDGEICAVTMMRQADRAARFGIDLIWLDRENCMADLGQLFVSNRKELSIMSAFGLDVDTELLLFSFKESLVKALSIEVGYFIDLKQMEISANPGGISVRLGEKVWTALLHGAIAHRYLVTAVTLAE